MNCRIACPFWPESSGSSRWVRLAVALGRVGFEAFLRYASQAAQKRLRLPFKHGEVLRSGGRSSSGLVLLPP